MTGLIGKLAYAILAGIVAFLIVLGIGLLIIHFTTSPDGASYGSQVKGLATIIGVLVAIWYFFGHPGWNHSGSL